MKYLFLIMLILIPSPAITATLDIKNGEMIVYLEELDEIMGTISSAVMGCMDAGKTHQKCMCESKSHFMDFKNAANAFFEKYPQLEEHDLINYKNSESVLVNMSLEGIKKQASMKIDCDKK